MSKTAILEYSKPKLGILEVKGHPMNLDYLLGIRDLDEAEEEIPVALEWINSAIQDYTEQKLVSKSVLKSLEGKTYLNLKVEGLKSFGIEKTTETALEHVINNDDEILAAYESLAILTGWVGRLYGLQENLRLKIDMLRTIDATRRKLIEHDE